MYFVEHNELSLMATTVSVRKPERFADDLRSGNFSRLPEEVRENGELLSELLLYAYTPAEIEAFHQTLARELREI